jgi:hypothetical protein
MAKFTRFAARAGLMVVGLGMGGMGIRAEVEKRVQIKQKVVRYGPIEKLLDGLVLILSGGRGISEVNTRVRPDAWLQAAFGRDGCAEQSTSSDTLNACDGETVAQLRAGVCHLVRGDCDRAAVGWQSSTPGQPARTDH